MVAAGIDLAGMEVLVTGAAGGIGSAVARRLDAAGANLHLIDTVPANVFEERVGKLARMRSFHACDVSDRKAVESLVRGLPALDALIDTAAICPFDDDWMAPDWNDESFMRVIRVNLLGPINLVRSVMPGMIERGFGRIVLCGSLAGWMGGLRAGPHYTASKGGVHALVRWFSQRAVSHGVTVNGVAPGPVKTGMTEKGGYEPSAYPMKRMGDPDEIAAAIVFLASRDASFMSGAILDVNGGTHLR